MTNDQYVTGLAVTLYGLHRAYHQLIIASRTPNLEPSKTIKINSALTYLKGEYEKTEKAIIHYGGKIDGDLKSAIDICVTNTAGKSPPYKSGWRKGNMFTDFYLTQKVFDFYYEPPV